MPVANWREQEQLHGRLPEGHRSCQERMMLATQSKATEVRAWPVADVPRRPFERLRPSDNTRATPHGNVVAGLAACDLLPGAQIISAKHHFSLIASSGTSVIAEMTDCARYASSLTPLISTLSCVAARSSPVVPHDIRPPVNRSANPPEYRTPLVRSRT